MKGDLTESCRRLNEVCETVWVVTTSELVYPESAVSFYLLRKKF